MLMEGKQSDSEPCSSTSDLNETECLCEDEHSSNNGNSSSYSPKSYETDRRRAKSLPVYLDQSSTLTECQERGKRVQFADTMGLNLTTVRHFDISDDGNEACDVSGLQSCPSQHDTDFMSAHNFAHLVPAFKISSDLVDLKSRHLGVALESVTTGSEVKGLIRVMRSNGRKDVGVRYTVNNWLTHTDIQAAPRWHEDDVLQWEKYHFTLHAPPFLTKDSSVHFAVYCRTVHGEHWDNNDGQNYALRVQIT